jgi:serine/threonine protein kinase
MADAPEELLDNYEIGRIIGHGHYAIVRECKDTNTGFKFALKAIDLKKLINKVIRWPLITENCKVY